jgi:hypothetical protein
VAAGALRHPRGQRLPATDVFGCAGPAGPVTMPSVTSPSAQNPRRPRLVICGYRDRDCSSPGG